MYFYSPVPSSCSVSCEFGPYPPHIAKLTGRTDHLGIDFAPPDSSRAQNISIMAAGTGTILRTGTDPAAGRYMIISHLFSYGLFLTFYMHMSDIIGKRNQLIRQGEKIGTMGATGLVTGPHLHFGFARLYLDRITFIDPRKHILLP